VINSLDLVASASCRSLAALSRASLVFSCSFFIVSISAAWVFLILVLPPELWGAAGATACTDLARSSCAERASSAIVCSTTQRSARAMLARFSRPRSTVASANFLVGVTSIVGERRWIEAAPTQPAPMAV
jgi:hypothetical protein